MSFELAPRWKPLRYTPTSFPLFDPVLVPERGLLVVGGSDALTVFAIGDRQFKWFDVPKKSWITGFTVSASSLYVQDGPVLVNYDLTMGKPFSALNLVTGERWSLDDDTQEPPDSLYQLSGDKAVLLARLIAARQAHASALLQGQERITALATAQQGARGIDFSPPIVRKLQVEGRRGSQVFSLCMDGRLYAMDTALEEALTLASDEMPLRPELAMAEVPGAGGHVDCFLYYVTTEGGIRAINATGNLAGLPGWRGAAKPLPAQVAPLRYIDGLLMGGGILGAAFFARPLDPTKPAVLAMAGPAGGWPKYDVSPREKLVLLSNGQASRLACYDAAAKCPTRWKPDRASPAGPAHALFWPGADPADGSPRLILELDEQAPAGQRQVQLRVLPANSVDTPDPALIPAYPPPAVVLDQGKLTSGPKPEWLPTIDQLACRPVVTQHSLYTVVCAKPQGAPAMYWVAAFTLTPQVSDLLPKAAAEIARLRQLATPLQLKVERIDRWYEKGPARTWRLRVNGPYPLGNQKVALNLAPGGEIEVNTDANGIARFDTAHTNAAVTAKGPGTSTSARLNQTLSTITITVERPRGQ